MSIRTKLGALALAALTTGFALSLGSGPAAATATCGDGKWHRAGSQGQSKCYYLPTVSNGRVTGVAQTYEWRKTPTTPGGIAGGAGHGPYYHPGSPNK
jgi:hypothetical protein